jgi:V-type H+-transporting ATPase subunit a
MRSQEEIVYLNSFKMKTAVMYGVAQMLLGTAFRMSNQAYQKKWVDLIFEGVTQFVMLFCLFGFMDLMIIGKWLTNWDEMATEGYQPPGVIMAMIVMFLSGGVYEQPTKEGALQYAELVGNQTFWMNWCVIIAFTCVPFMLLVKPCYYSRKHKVNEDDNF